MSSVRTMLSATAGAVLCAVAAGCTTTLADGPASSPSPSLSSSPAPTPVKVSLRFAVYGDRAIVDAYSELARAFTRSNPHVTIDVESARSADAAMADLDREFARGDAPDVFLVEHDSLPQMVVDERVQPVDQLLEDRQVDFGDGYQRDGLEAFSAQSSLQCMPHDVSPTVVYYNQDLVDLGSLVEEGEDPPNAEDGWTWEQFTTAAREASRGRTKGVYLDASLQSLAPFIWSAGGELVDDNEAPTTLELSDGDTRAALEQVLALVRDPQVTPTRSELARRDAVARFKTGRLAMIVGDRELTPELRTAKGLDFEVFPLPSLGRYRTVSSMSGYCISADSDNVQAAADFLAFAVGREGATITTKPGYVVPSNLEVAHSPAFTQPGQQPANAFVFNEGVRRTSPTPFVPEWPQVTEEMQPLLDRLFYAPVIDLDTLLTAMESRSSEIFAQPTQSPSP